MPKVKLISISCEATEDNGSDTPFITFNGKLVWSLEDVGAGDIIPLDAVMPIMFRRRAVIKFFDYNWPASGDELGTLVIEKTRTRFDEEITSIFSKDIAHYTLRYLVEN